MAAHLGTLGVAVAFVATLLGAALEVVSVGLRARSVAVPPWLEGRRLVVLALAGVLLSVGAMEDALVTHNFTIAYVASNNATVTPLLYSITGLWSAL
ncbi:MAG TPA: hypothetical protein VKT18_04845, partial [Acidimicrobiales bacterium]|nr:hypothetical protein [Acidimicrobiales bacterium]